MINQCFKNQGKLFRGTLKISHQQSCERSQVSMNNKSKGWYPQPYYKDYAYLLHGWYPFPNKEEDSSRRPITLKGLIAPGYNLAGPFAVPHFSSTFYASLDHEPSRVHAYTDLHVQWRRFQTKKYAKELGWRGNHQNLN